MSRGEIPVFDELFSYACPRFITAAPPSFDPAAANTNQQVRAQYWINTCMGMGMARISGVARQGTIPLLFGPAAADAKHSNCLAH
jgi:hypothetical protein